MLTNLWYVAGEAAAVTNAPIKVRLLGQDLVVFRDGAGQLACLSDICIHRGAALSRGRTIDGCVECPYHGWRYDRDGRVTRIPAEPDAKIPSRARIDSYPTVEKYGWIWVFIGDLPAALRPPIPDMPEYEDPEIRWVRGVWDWQVNYHRAVENGLDFAHAPFVHGATFGDRERPQISEFTVEESAWGGRSKMIMSVPHSSKGLWALFSDRKELEAGGGASMVQFVGSHRRPRVVSATGLAHVAAFGPYTSGRIHHEVLVVDGPKLHEVRDLRQRHDQAKHQDLFGGRRSDPVPEARTRAGQSA